MIKEPAQQQANQVNTAIGYIGTAPAPCPTCGRCPTCGAYSPQGHITWTVNPDKAFLQNYNGLKLGT